VKLNELNPNLTSLARPVLQNSTQLASSTLIAASEWAAMV
jgi:hypothetical protein